MLTGQQLQSIMPSIPTARREALLPFLQAAMTEFAIETPARVAAFVAQLAHEFRTVPVHGGDLGPDAGAATVQAREHIGGDAREYRDGRWQAVQGRGPIQITGRANYKRFGDLLGIDLMSDPAHAARPELAFRIAGLFWSKKGLSELAEHATDEAFRQIPGVSTAASMVSRTVGSFMPLRALSSESSRKPSRAGRRAHRCTLTMSRRSIAAPRRYAGTCENAPR